MNLIEAFIAFDSWTRLNTLSANQRSLYIAIMQLWNAAGRPEYSTIPEQKLTELSGLSKKTFYNVRDQLEEFGLISVVKSKNKNVAPKYILEDISVKSDDDFTPEVTLKENRSVKNDSNFTPHVTPELTLDVTPISTPKLAPYTEKRIEEERREESRRSSNSNLSQLIEFYENNFGKLPPLVLDDLNYAYNDYGYELTLEAMKRAVRQQKNFRTALNILDYWSRNGVKTLADAEAESKAFNQRKNQAVTENKVSPKAGRNVPEWTDEGRLIKAGVDTTGMTQNEMYKLAGEMGLHDA
ncbi:DnaD domain protein [Lactococcus lactis]